MGRFGADKLAALFCALLAGPGTHQAVFLVMLVAFLPADVTDFGANQCDFIRPIRLPGQFMSGKGTGVRADQAYLDTTGQFQFAFVQTFVGTAFACFEALLAGLDALFAMVVGHGFMDMVDGQISLLEWRVE
jgi:hypothetical protein